MAQVFFISTEKLLERSDIHVNVEDKKLNPLILRCQDVNIEPAIGTTLYKRLIDGVESSNLSVDEITLINDYIVPYLVVCVTVRAIPLINTEIRNKNVGKSSDQYAQAGTWKDVEAHQKEYSNDLAHYQRKLVGYLKDNADKYPEYEHCSPNHEDISPSGQRDSYTGVFSVVLKNKRRRGYGYKGSTQNGYEST